MEEKQEILKEYLTNNKCKGFKSVPHYDECGTLSYFFNEDPSYVKVIDANVEIFVSFDNKYLNGFQIYGLKNTKNVDVHSNSSCETLTDKQKFNQYKDCLNYVLNNLEHRSVRFSNCATDDQLIKYIKYCISDEGLIAGVKYSEEIEKLIENNSNFT